MGCGLTLIIRQNYEGGFANFEHFWVQKCTKGTEQCEGGSEFGLRPG